MSRYARRYTPELAARILDEVESGRALHRVCRDDGIPPYPTVYGWVLRDIEGFAGRYARACDGSGRRGARAIQYSPELAERILREIARGRSLHDICRDDDMPSERTVYHWVSDNREGFCARYFQARQAGRFKMGRPTLYTRELADRILFELSDGRTLRDICRADGMPSTATVRLWALEDRDGFAARYRTARENAHHDMSDEIVEIIDDGRNDWMERRARDGGFETVPNPESVPRSRLRYDGRTWLLKNRLPKHYGKHVGTGDMDKPIDPWAELLKAVDGKTRGLPSQCQPAISHQKTD